MTAVQAAARAGYRGEVDAKTRMRIVTGALALLFAVTVVAGALGR
jgi:hypothetical protein